MIDCITDRIGIDWPATRPGARKEWDKWRGWKQRQNVSEKRRKEGTQIGMLSDNPPTPKTINASSMITHHSILKKSSIILINTLQSTLSF